MAKSRKSTVKATVPFVGLAAIIAATQADSFVYTSKEEHDKLIADGLAEINTQFVNEAGFVATRATPKGIASMTQTNSAPTVAPNVAKTAFVLEDNVPMPAATGRGRLAGATKYPFDAMQVGQSFFVAVEPAKLASTVSSAKARYSEDIPGETKTNRKGDTVQATRFTRNFVVRKAEKDGVAGSRIFRTE